MIFGSPTSSTIDDSSSSVSDQQWCAAEDLVPGDIVFYRRGRYTGLVISVMHDGNHVKVTTLINGVLGNYYKEYCTGHIILVRDL